MCKHAESGGHNEHANSQKIKVVRHSSIPQSAAIYYLGRKKKMSLREAHGDFRGSRSSWKHVWWGMCR